MQNATEWITSRQNPLVQLTVSLSDRKKRTREGLFRFDGRKLFGEALAGGLPLAAVLLRESSADELLAFAGGYTLPEGCRTAVLPNDLFDRISEENAPEGVICLCKQLCDLHKTLDGENLAAWAKMLASGRTLVLESVRDPGNLGTIIRSAAAFGVSNLVVSADCADIYHPRTLRAAMGAAFKKPVLTARELPRVIEFLATRGRVFAAALDESAVRLGEIEIGKTDTVIVGNEGHGISREVLLAATDTLYIPMESGVESLNAGVAASVLLWELYRGR